MEWTNMHYQINLTASDAEWTIHALIVLKIKWTNDKSDRTKSKRGPCGHGNGETSHYRFGKWTNGKV